MKKSKILKALILGIFMSVMSSILVFANDNEANRGVTDSSDSIVSVQVVNEEVVDENILKKQEEINVLLFDQYKDEISQKGFQITNTSTFKEYVEVGILPYSDGSADYLYAILGKDMVKIIEGQEFMITAGQEPYIETTVVQKDAEKANNLMMPLLIVGVCVLGGIAILSTRRES